MGKKSRTKGQSSATTGEVGPRQPCPCGSGRRYKACHGQADGAPPVFHRRPFAGLPSECDLVALREFVPAASAPARLRDSDREVLLCSLLPGATPALVRDDGAVWLGLQVQHAYGDPSRDLAACLQRALEAEPGTVIGLTEDPGDGPRLQDLLAEEPLEVSVHDSFDYWVEDAEGATAAALEEVNASIAPTRRVEGVTLGAAYWTEMGDHEYLRWVLPHDEDPLLDALARLHTAEQTHLVEGDRVIGTFRAYGLLAPVWDLPPGTGAEALVQPAADFAVRLEEALASTEPLTTQERSARAGLTSRQLTIR